MTMATKKMMTTAIHLTRKQMMMQKISTRAVKFSRIFKRRKSNFKLTSPTQNGSSRSHSIQRRQWPKVANHLCCKLLTVSFPWHLLTSKRVALLSIDVLCISNYKLINLNYCGNTSWYGKKFEKCAEIQLPIGHRSSAILIIIHSYLSACAVTTSYICTSQPLDQSAVFLSPVSKRIVVVRCVLTSPYCETSLW